MAVKLHPGAQASGRLLGRVDFDEGHFLYHPARQPDLQQLNNIRKQTRYQLRNVLLVYQFLLAIISIQVRFLSPPNPRRRPAGALPPVIASSTGGGYLVFCSLGTGM